MKIKNLRIVEMPYNAWLPPEIQFGRMENREMIAGMYGNIMMTTKPHGTKDFKIAEWKYGGGLTICINNHHVGYSAFSKRPWRLFYKFSAHKAIVGNKASCRSFKTFDSLIKAVLLEVA